MTFWVSRSAFPRYFLVIKIKHIKVSEINNHPQLLKMHSQVKFLVIFLIFNQSDASQVGKQCKPSINSQHPIYMDHPTNCSRFLTCSNGIWYEMECPARLQWNAERQVCDWPSEVRCKLSHLNSHQIIPASVTHLSPYEVGAKCNPSNERLAAHSSDCSKFMICNRLWIEMECPGHLLFSIDTLHCEYPQNAKCCENCKALKKECEVEGSRFVQPDSCGSYFECQQGMLVEVKCSEIQHYDPILGMCIDGVCNFLASTTLQALSENKLPSCNFKGALYPNHKDCSKFYVCNGSTLVAQSCPPSTFFSTSHNNCKDKAHAVCAS